ncbi:cytochrome c maturation protein CcmE [Nitrospirillum pindoramense]|uniref:Cytochrome c-type biogenesis protein CcmE n=1 Tax=Nitrospirillum amazonense TaxID=28077 RepID=A0A560GVM8_9PROT|nr:cytochrome c maturation protein CcmE [Nitrospirillum amazonense]TWB38086.1 cytochrome c-type biogenesis protein CcmE [Nitrospirillum amazonense]
MTRKRRRLMILVLALLGLGTATALTLSAFRDNIVFFYSPSDLAAKPPGGRTVRIGGLVEAGSLKREGGMTVTFQVTDTAKSLPVTYTGILPDLFREGQGVVAEGKLGPDGVFTATELLAKHDEKYMPPDVADALKRAGHPGKPGDTSSGGAPVAAGEEHQTSTLRTHP